MEKNIANSGVSLPESAPRYHPGPLSASVIMCAYTEERWNDLVDAVASIDAQTTAPKELILVIDHNPRLFERARDQFPQALVVENHEEKGLSGARNSGIAAASGEIVAFMDEDAVAEPDWLECLLEGYTGPEVMGVGGAINPLWMAGRPAWFPDEFDWVVGCTYRGMPKRTAPVRNLIGANMSVRREVLEALGGFRTGLGRVNTLPLGCEETELCIRALQRWPEGSFIYNPAARVGHHVPAKRGTLGYFVSRCYAEGISKAAVARLVGAGDGLSSERQYTLRTLPAGVLRGIKNGLSGHIAGLGRSTAILTGLGITGLGYLAGTVSQAARAKTGSATGRATVAIPATGRANAHPKILMVTPLFLPHTGGVENHVYEVSRRMARDGADVTVLTTDTSGKLPKREQMDGFQVIRVRAWPKHGDFYFAPGIYSTIRKGYWDLIHLQSYHTFVPLLAMAAALKSHIPYVLTFHGGGHSAEWRNKIRRYQRKLMGPFLRKAQRLIANANFEIRQYGRELHVPPERFALIPNGSDLPVVQAASADHREFKANPEECLIASVGRLERYKGHHRLVAAMPFILQKIPQAHLWIAGNGPDEANLRRQIEQLGLQGKVEIRPIPASDRQAMANELSQADLYVLLSEFETHPIAVLEAISLGVPALVTDTSGLGELAEKGLASSIPLNSTSLQIAQAVIRLIENPQRPPAVHLPTWDDCARALFSLYREIISSFNGIGESHAYSDVNPNVSANFRRD